MESTIENTLKTAYIDKKILEEVFYFVCTSFFCQTTIEGEIFPAEIALVKFSLRLGIIDSLQIFINPGQLPLGYSNDAMLKSESSHKIPVPPSSLCEAEANYYEIRKHVLNFINDGTSDVPALYCNHKEIKTTKMIFEKIWRESECHIRLKIFELDQLLCRLKKFTSMWAGFDKNQSAVTNLLIARDMIDKVDYYYYKF